jgi:hypothetical protein
MRVAATIVALLASCAMTYGSLLAAFLAGGLHDAPRLVGHLSMATLLIAMAGALAVWWRPKAAAGLLGLALLGWLAFFVLAVVVAPARANDVPGARLNLLSILVCLVPALLLLLGAFLAIRAEAARSAAHAGM